MCSSYRLAVDARRIEAVPSGSYPLAGGKAPALARSVIGVDNVARLLVSIFPVLVRIDMRVEPREVNGQPGAILRDRDSQRRPQPV